MTPARLSVYVPADGDLGIDPGSGIVGTPAARDGRLVVIDYEGNRYGFENVKSFADRVTIAAGRHVAQYPTVARASVHVNDVIEVGYYYSSIGRVEPKDGQSITRLCRWLGLGHDQDGAWIADTRLLAPELTDSLARKEVGA